MKNASAWFAALGGALVLGTMVWSEVIVQQPDKKEGKVIVTYWEKWTNFEADAMRVVVEEFNRSQDKIYVEYLSVSNVSNKTMLSTAGGIPPDVAGLFGGNIAQYASNGAVMPLDELAKEAGIEQEQYIPVYWNMCTYRGKLWALPTTPASTALHYNKGILEEAGLDPNKPPTTIEELDEMDAKILKRDASGKIVKMGFLPTEPGWWPWSWPSFFGGSLWNGYDKITMATPENVRAYEWVRSYTRRYGLGTVQAFQQGFGGFDSPQNGFLDNKLASVIQGVWMYNFITKHNPEMKWAAVPFPHPAYRPDKANTTVIDLDVLVIPRGAKHPKEAFEFIKFVQSQKGMELLCLGQKKHSPLIKVSDEFIQAHPNPYVMLFAQQALSVNAASPPKTPIWPQWGDEIKTALEKINTDPNLSVKEALLAVEQKMQIQLDRVLESERKLGILPEDGSRPSEDQL